MKKNAKPVWTVVFTAAILLVICVLGVLCWYLFSIYSSGKESDGLKDIVMVSSSVVDTDSYDDKPSSSVVSKNTDSKGSTDTSDDTDKKKQVSSKKKDTDTDTEKNKAPKKEIINNGINFTNVWEINEDVYAWIKVPNTPIDYPVLQYAGDDSFYLEHSVFKQYSFGGSIYTEKLNSKDFSDPNTVLYGHNLLNGTMFAGLHNFRDPNFFAQNPYIYIYMPDRTLTYLIFSAYEYDDRHILYSFDFDDDEVFEEYLEYAKNPENSMTYNTREVDVTTDDTIITLSTCMDDIATSRYLVQGVLISNDPASE